MQSVIAAAGFSEADAVAYAAALEKMSEHPLAEAIVGYAQEKQAVVPAVEELRICHR